MITVDDTDQAYSLDKIGVSVSGSGGIFRASGTSAHTISDSLGASSSLTLLLQRLYTLEYIMSNKGNQ